ncbi:hypothetical protein [Clostridium diolis]|uniref:hypothetical protein n=1 Tax=Clostridium diolis TaxID=223919 RepID=UPI003AF92D21
MMVICSSCGNIISENDKNAYEFIMDLNKDRMKCKCGKLFNKTNIYPKMQVSEFLIIADELYNSCKDNDKNNRKEFINYAKENGYDFSNEEVINYLNINEAIKTKYPDNELGKHSLIDDEFENRATLKYKNKKDNIELFLIIGDIYFINKFRKSFIIMVASILEMLFNDFFKNSIEYSLGIRGGKVFLDRYDHAGVKECLDILDAFLDKPLREKMNEIENGFFDKWNTLRNERNAIIHSNSRYISIKRANDVYKMIDDGIKVFSRLNSKLYAGN